MLLIKTWLPECFLVRHTSGLCFWKAAFLHRQPQCDDLTLSSSAGEEADSRPRAQLAAGGSGFSRTAQSRELRFGRKCRISAKKANVSPNPNQRVSFRWVE